jgi:hypothetical protein
MQEISDFSMPIHPIQPIQPKIKTGREDQDRCRIPFIRTAITASNTPNRKVAKNAE